MKTKAKTVKHPVKKIVKPSVKRKALKPKRKTMANPDQKTNEKVDEKTPSVQPLGHKNPPIGPATGKPLADWNKFRDYEQFNPTPEK